MADDSRNYEDEEGDWPTVTIRMPEVWIDLAEKIASEEDNFYDKSGVIRYAMDRKFETNEGWQSTTDYDPQLESLITEYGQDLGLIEKEEEQGEGESKDEEFDRMDAFLEGEREQTVGNIDRFDYAVTMYSIARSEGDQERLQKAADYLKEHYPDSDFTRFVV